MIPIYRKNVVIKYNVNKVIKSHGFDYNHKAMKIFSNIYRENVRIVGEYIFYYNYEDMKIYPYISSNLKDSGSLNFYFFKMAFFIGGEGR